MAERNSSLLNQLHRDLPEGLLVDSRWLERRGISSSLRSYYVKSGWLEQPARGVYRWPRRRLTWQDAVISLQTILDGSPLVVGGRTALELRQRTHFLSPEFSSIHLHGPRKPPLWLSQLDLPQQFVFHKSAQLFHDALGASALGSLIWDVEAGHGRDLSVLKGGELEQFTPRETEWPLTLSRPERAFLELLDELPDHESFSHAALIMQGAADFSPRRLQRLLVNCRSVKVKRLFFVFADRARHAWLKHLDKDAIDLGKGKRVLVPGGRLDPVYLITVPRDLDAVS